jgi:hypothetical protein
VSENPTPEPRSFAELRDSGLLWLVNRVCFHPHGFALALVTNTETGEAIGWDLLGDGSEVWRFGGDEDEHFEQVRRTFAEATPTRAA